MCNLSGRIEQKGIEQGIKQGIERGIAQGKAIEFMSTVEQLKETLSVSQEEVLNILGKTMWDYTNAQKLLK